MDASAARKADSALDNIQFFAAGERTMLNERTECLSGAATYTVAARRPQMRAPSSAFHDRVGEGSRPEQTQVRSGPSPRRGWAAYSSRAARGPAPTVVVYHHLSTTPHKLTDGLGVNTDPDNFRRHMKYFAKNFDVIGPSDLIAGRLPKRPLLITFDDVYRSVLEVGGPILKDANIQSVWFMNPDCLQAETLPLDNLLALAYAKYGGAGLMRTVSLSGKPPSSVPALISDYISRLTYLQNAELKAAICAGFTETQTQIRRGSNLFLTADDLKLLPDFGIHVGNHSLTHSFFRALSPTELQIEIVRSRELLEQLSGQSVTYLAIPYGNKLDATGAALSTARASGHQAIFLVHGRCNSWQPADDVFYRICADRLRPEHLPISIEILPRLRTFRDWLRGERGGL